VIRPGAEHLADRRRWIDTMKRWSGILGAGIGIGCGSASPHPIAPMTPVVSHGHVALQDAWPAAPDSGDLVARTPAGPFANLSAGCAALDRKESEDRFEGCHPREDDELDGAASGSIVRLGHISSWEPVHDEGEQPTRREHLTVPTPAGWFVLDRRGRRRVPRDPRRALTRAPPVARGPL
jgi:hypothetical protein